MFFVPQFYVSIPVRTGAFLPDGLGEFRALLGHLLQVLVLVLGVLLSVSYLILQRGPGFFQLLLQTGHLKTDETLTSIFNSLINEKQNIHFMLISLFCSTKLET